MNERTTRVLRLGEDEHLSEKLEKGPVLVGKSRKKQAQMPINLPAQKQSKITQCETVLY